MDRNRDAQRRPDDVRHDGDVKHTGAREAKRDALMTDISARLRRVCQHWTDDAFARLVADMADTKLRFAAIDADAWPHRDRRERSTGTPSDGPPAEA